LGEKDKWSKKKELIEENGRWHWTIKNKINSSPSNQEEAANLGDSNTLTNRRKVRVHLQTLVPTGQLY